MWNFINGIFSRNPDPPTIYETLQLSNHCSINSWLTLDELVLLTQSPACKIPWANLLFEPQKHAYIHLYGSRHFCITIVTRHQSRIYEPRNKIQAHTEWVSPLCTQSLCSVNSEVSGVDIALQILSQILSPSLLDGVWSRMQRWWADEWQWVRVEEIGLWW